MLDRASTPRSMLLASICAAGLLVAGPRPLGAQAQRGRLERLGGPGSLLRQPLSAMRGLRALVEAERRGWEPAYRGEELRLGPSQEWVGHSWSVRLSAVGDTIYRVALETFVPELTAADGLYRTLSEAFLTELGEPSQEDCTDFRWWGEDGDAFVRTTDTADGRRVTVVFTSNIVRTFTRI